MELKNCPACGTDLERILELDRQIYHNRKLLETVTKIKDVLMSDCANKKEVIDYILEEIGV